jgi:thiamine monophosphate kinase
MKNQLQRLSHIASWLVVTGWLGNAMAYTQTISNNKDEENKSTVTQYFNHLRPEERKKILSIDRERKILNVNEDNGLNKGLGKSLPLAMERLKCGTHEESNTARNNYNGQYRGGQNPSPQQSAEMFNSPTSVTSSGCRMSVK